MKSRTKWDQTQTAVQQKPPGLCLLVSQPAETPSNPAAPAAPRSSPGPAPGGRGRSGAAFKAPDLPRPPRRGRQQLQQTPPTLLTQVSGGAAAPVTSGTAPRTPPGAEDPLFPRPAPPGGGFSARAGGAVPPPPPPVPPQRGSANTQLGAASPLPASAAAPHRSRRKQQVCVFPRPSVRECVRRTKGLSADPRPPRTAAARPPPPARPPRFSHLRRLASPHRSPHPPLLFPGLPTLAPAPVGRAAGPLCRRQRGGAEGASLERRGPRRLPPKGKRGGERGGSAAPSRARPSRGRGQCPGRAHPPLALRRRAAGED